MTQHDTTNFPDTRTLPTTWTVRPALRPPCNSPPAWLARAGAPLVAQPVGAPAEPGVVGQILHVADGRDGQVLVVDEALRHALDGGRRDRVDARKQLRLGQPPVVRQQLPPDVLRDAC